MQLLGAERTMSSYVKKTELEKKINRYVRGYAQRHKITKEQALQREIVKNVIEWLKIREGKGNNEQ